MANKGSEIERTNIQYGYNLEQSRVVMEFSRTVRTLFMTPAEVDAMVQSLTQAKKEFEEHVANKARGGPLNG